jgi:tetratricopeptide (TPR) repeat protein
LYQTAVNFSQGGQSEAAIRTYAEQIPLYRKSSDPGGEAATWISIGALYDAAGKEANAVENFENALKLYRQVSDRKAAAATLLRIGKAWTDSEVPDAKQKAEQSFKQSLAIYQNEHDASGEASALVNIGDTFTASEARADKQLALSYYDRAAAIYREAKGFSEEATALTKLAGIYNGISSDDAIDDAEREKARLSAVKTYNLAREASGKMADRKEAADNLAGIGRQLSRLNEKGKAVEAYLEAAKLYGELGLTSEQVKLHISSAIIYNTPTTKNPRLAIENYVQALSLYRLMGDLRRQATTLRSIGMIYGAEGDKAKASDYYTQALRIFEQIPSPSDVTRTNLLIKNLAKPEKK